MVRVRHCLFFPFPLLSFSFLFPFPLPFLFFPFPSFTIPFPFPFPRSCEFFGQGVKPALGKTIRGKQKDNIWKNHLKGLGVFTRPHMWNLHHVWTKPHLQRRCKIVWLFWIQDPLNWDVRINKWTWECRWRYSPWQRNRPIQQTIISINLLVCADTI